MNIGAFVCSCRGQCGVDAEEVRDGVRDVDIVASSRLLCQDGFSGVEHVIEEYEIDQIVASACDQECQNRIQSLAESHGLHPEATAFVDHRESAGWVHDEEAATDKAARLFNRTTAGLKEEAFSRTVSQETGDRVAVVGNPRFAETVATETDADVTLVANGDDFDDYEGALADVTVQRGRIEGIEGEYGEFDIHLRACVTDDCISCMECVEQGPDGGVTSVPVDVHPDAPTGEWIECCPTDAIDPDGIDVELTADQVVYPGARDVARGGRVGFHTDADAHTVASVQRHLGGVEKPQFLDIDMDVCASGDSGQQGCTVCTDACPHDAVARPTVDSVTFDPIACQNCGACTSGCPTGAVELREPSNRRIAREVEALLDPSDDDGGLFSIFRGDSGIDTPVVAFVCSERAARTLETYGRRAAEGADIAYPPVLPVRVTCTDTVGEAHLLHALAAGADGVAIVGCGGECLHSGPDPKTALAERLNVATTDLGLGNRVEFFVPDPNEPGAFEEALSQFYVGLDATPIPPGEHEADGGSRDGEPYPEFNTHDWALESVRAILSHVDPDRDVVRGLEAFGRMSVSDDCAFTPTCTNLCPTDAIRRTDDADLQFAHEDCVNCGVCETGCPEVAITIESGLDLSSLPERRAGVETPDDASESDRWETVYESEMLDCANCGKSFTSVDSAAHVQSEVGHLVEGIGGEDHDIFEYCSDCRAKLIYGETQ
ncbi:hydrogenase iron-sulfur subunit [Halopenitus sp. H-Gu1]|uniref:hydrogenase iron-sulfur subunit n=1 Tax=Halopenitus sp. H-Gu1 TaxID=3242697 RepID=UPI00359E641C